MMIIWTEEMISQLGTDGDGMVAAALGISVTAVRKKRKQLGIPSSKEHVWTEWLEDQLGTVSDKAFVSLHNLRISPSAVAFRRRELGIPPAEHSKQKTEWTEAMLERLGRAHDRVIAQELGLGYDNVASKRRMMGIPPCPK